MINPFRQQFLERMRLDLFEIVERCYFEPSDYAKAMMESYLKAMRSAKQIKDFAVDGSYNAMQAGSGISVFDVAVTVKNDFYILRVAIFSQHGVETNNWWRNTTNP